ncbi:hypothetical protein MMC08_001669 [Hypocenomyce scalaris]|nr:hypothetical protein [Hypocenomyce scalaris]
MIDPSTQARMVRSLIDIYRHEGYLPDCRMQLCKGFTQGGSNADVVLAESFLKNITESIDWVTGYEAVIADAEDEPRNWQYEGRGSLESWKDLHYVPVDAYDPHGHRGLKTRSVSRTVEYAYNDYCIAGMAQRMGRTADYEKYMTRSQNWQHLFLADQTSSINGVNTGFTGFLQPKSMNGTWRSQDPVLCSPLSSFGCYLDNNGHETYEGSIWLYTFFVPGDMASLVAALGGPSTFTKRLDFLHTSGLLDIGDEQGFLPIFQYHYGGRPGLSAARAHYYIPSRFNDTLGGLPGNDDGGGMGSFVALAMMGLYPNAGQDVYLITPPFFKEVNITNGQTGRTATIRNLNFDPEYQNLYIQSATLDGKPYTRSWISHSFLLGGGVLELTLGWKESSWGQADADVPPSSSTSGTPRKPIIQY